MSGSYCKFCGHRCFVYRLVPNSRVTHLATCRRGMSFDRERTGYDHTTAFNPLDQEQLDQYIRERAANKRTQEISA
jgi:hypothetical protein